MTAVAQVRVSKFATARQSALVQSILIDCIGMASYLAPGLLEGTDLVVAPVLALWIAALHKNYLAAGIGLAEELLPFTDIVPTATITWYYRFMLNEAKTRLEYDS